MENQVSSLSGEQILANAIALAPMIRECRDEIERERRLPMRLVDAMKKAGIFRMPMGNKLLTLCDQHAWEWFHEYALKNSK